MSMFEGWGRRIFGSKDGSAETRDREGRFEPDLNERNVPTFYRCRTLLTNTIGQFPFQVTGLSDAENQRVTTMLNDAPTEGWDGYMVRSWIVGRVIDKGVARLAAQRRGSATTGVVPIRQPVEIIRDNDTNEILAYDTKEAGRVNVADMIVVHGPLFDGKGSASVLETGVKNPVQTAHALDRYSRFRLGKGFWSQLLVMLEGRATKEVVDKTREEVKDLYGKGVDSIAEPMVVGRQVKNVQSMQPSSRDLQLISDKQHTNREIATALGVPPHMAGLEDAGGAWGRTFAEQRRQFVQFTTSAYETAIGNAFTRVMFPSGNGKVALDNGEFLKGLPEENDKLWRDRYESGAVTLDEYREGIGLKALGDARGQSYYEESQPQVVTGD